MQGPQNNYQHFFGVLDGHGSQGHLVSAFIKDSLPEILKLAIKQSSNKDVTEAEYTRMFEDAFLLCDD